MARNGISEDKIKYVIDVETSEAQRHIYQMNEKLNELNKDYKNLDKSMVELEAQGKKDNATYNELKSRKAELSKEIKGLKQEIKDETAQLDTQALSMSQLKKRARELQRELNDIIPAMQPERYEELAGNLNEVNARMAELKEKTVEFKRVASDDDSENFFWSSARIKVLDWVSQNFSDMISKVRELASESLDLAISADGVTKAFNDLNNPGILDELRAATKGTVNDFELMKATVQAKDFRIPLEDLGKYLQFAQLKAQQTGQSVDYMTNSIITGLGRKSAMILDNLGISAAEINEKIAQTGDFMKAVGVIVENQLEAAGEGYVSMADKIAQKNTELQNAQLKLGQSLIPYKETYDKIFGGAELQIIKLLAVVLKYEGVIKSLTVAIGIFTVASIACNKALWTTIASTKAATKAMAALNLVLKTNIWVALASAIIGVVSYLAIFRKKTDEAKEAMEEIAETEKEVSSSINDQTAKVRKLNDEMRNEKLSLDRRRAALEELKRIIPEYNGLLSKEGQLTRDNKEAIDAYIESLSKQIKLKAYEDKLTALYKQKSDLEDKRDETSKQYWDTRQTNTLQGSNRSLGGKILKFFGLDSESKLEKSLSSINTSITATDEKITMLENKIKDLGNISLKTTEAATVPVSSAAGQSSSGNRNNSSSNRDSQDLDTATINDLNSRHQQSLQAWQDYYDKKKAMLEEDCISEKITKEKYDELMLGLDQLNTAAIINIERSYYNESQSLQLTEDEKKKELVESYAQYVKNAEANSNQARLNAMKAYYDNLGKINQASADEQEMTLEQQLEAELKAVETYGEAGIAYARQFGQSEIAITEAIEKAKAAIRDKYREKKKEQEEQDQKQQEQNKENELRRETKYADEILAIKSKDWKKAAQAYKNLFADAIYALQDAELANVEAKYDAQIEAARQAGQDTTELENKKAQEKLAIEKKYADVNFAIKASQIIADTAVSIMMAYSQLGPIAGSIAAALMGITGAAQLAAANAERERVKKMTLSGSSSSTTSGARVATGLESGGRIDVEREQDGKHFNAEYDPNRRGYIDRPTVIVGEGPTGQSKEWVASNAAVTNPTVAPIIDIIDKAQRAGTVRTLDLRKSMISQISGRQSGGTITASPVPASGAAATVPGSSAAGQSSSGNRNNSSSKRDSQDLDTITINDLNSRHQQSLQAWQDYYDKKKAMLEEDCISEKITKEKYDELMLGLDQLNTAAIINIERSYYNESQSLQLTEDEKKKELVESYAQYVKNAEANSNQARLNAMKAYYDNLGKINQASADEQEMTLDQQLEAELKAVETYGEAGIAYARQFGQSEIAITEAVEKAKTAIRDKYREKKQEQEEQDQKQQEQNKENELQRETKYADEILAIKSKDWKKAAQAYKNLFSDAIYALQNAELANVEAKNDAQIEAARQAGQDTTELENKKAQEKLAIEKKYADVNFAIKASQNIADTAVSIMMAYSQLGPIAGSIAAALMGITGAAQLAAANAERERVKKMTLSGSSSSTATDARVETGLESGGRIDVEREQDGKHFNAEYDPNRRGYIDRPTVIVGEGPTGQSKEWVASNAAVTNPTVAPIIDIIDKAQRAGTVRTLDLRKFMISQISGRQSGGTITASPVPASGATATVPGSSAAGQSSSLSPSLIQDLTTVLSSLKEKGIKSYVALDDFDAQQKLRQKSRKIGSKL